MSSSSKRERAWKPSQRPRVWLDALLPNTRDAGGIRIAGGVIAARRLIRGPALAPDVGFLQLHEVPFDHVLDLRSPVEIAQQGKPGHSAQISYTLASITTPLRLPDSPQPSAYAQAYPDLAKAAASAVIALFEGLVRARSGVHVGCSLGKDRTGLVVAMALEALGADRRDVCHDFELSSRALRGADVLRPRLNASSSEFARRVELPAWVMRRALERIDAEHGSTLELLRSRGLTAHLWRETQSRLVCGPDDFGVAGVSDGWVSRRPAWRWCVL